MAKSIPIHEQPLWAGKVLELVARLPSVPEAVHKLAEIAQDPSSWSLARGLFSELRHRLLEIEKTPAKFEPHLIGVLCLAENVAKLTYNASGGPAPYDADSAYWLPQNVRYIIEHSEHEIDVDEVLSMLFMDSSRSE